MATVDLAAAWDAFALELAELLAPAGLVVTQDPQTLNPPCVLVGAALATAPRLGGWQAARLEVPVWLLAPPPGDADAERWLLRHAATVAEAIGAATMTPAAYNAQLPGRYGTARLAVSAVAEPPATILEELPS